MFRRLRVFVAGMGVLAAAALIAFLVAQGFGSRSAEAQAAPQHTLFNYSVKFVCGSIDSPPFKIPHRATAFEPNMMSASREPPVKPGNYATAVNIHNPHNDGVKLRKKAVIARPQGQPLGPVSGWQFDKLGPDQALEVDCRNIASMFLHPGTTGPRFIKGFVVVQALRELDVVGVYTSEKIEIVRSCAPLAANLNTGHNQMAGNLIAFGQPDDDWTVSPPGGPATVVQKHPAWKAPLVDSMGKPSRWISTNASKNGGLSGPPTPPTAKPFTYRIPFELAPGCTDATLRARMRADDLVHEVRLNGSLLAGPPGGNFAGPALGITATGPFLPGNNVLTVLVHDTQRVVTGFNLVGTVTSNNVSVGAGVGISIDVEYVEPMRSHLKKKEVPEDLTGASDDTDVAKKTKG